MSPRLSVRTGQLAPLQAVNSLYSCLQCTAKQFDSITGIATHVHHDVVTRCFSLLRIICSYPAAHLLMHFFLHSDVGNAETTILDAAGSLHGQ